VVDGTGASSSTEGFNGALSAGNRTLLSSTCLLHSRHSLSVATRYCLLIFPNLCLSTCLHGVALRRADAFTGLVYSADSRRCFYFCLFVCLLGFVQITEKIWTDSDEFFVGME